ncbi:FAD-dependent oxidoreductase [Paenibacillus sp. JX-17]|uniref:FAD-dependent oxidoreductase n=1 Tax=Paenibacillus lacisoli TaxID=3064525 RepID=A0ABT9CCC5_9BACL|nr:FAD-dependent oxidoreductase [Paenibacillus sp. JX-17]MDO7906309.1 FAD-dependent oxidoreductase [Paenibacillus sp. JX-17]
MDLHHGQLYWRTTEPPHLDVKPVPVRDYYDVVIVGGGMSGSLCAYTLIQEGLQIAVIDSGEMGGGSTSANTGLLQFSNDIMLHELIEQIGEENAVRFYRLCLEALDQLEEAAETIEDTGAGSSHFIRRSSLCYASTEADKAKLIKEYEALTRHGFPVEYWDEDKLEAEFPFSKPAALITHRDAEVNPLRFNHGVMRYLLDHGADLFDHTEAKQIEDTADGIEVHTNRGVFRAGHVIVTTGYSSPPLLGNAGLDLNRSYVIVTEPIEDLSSWKENMMIWETKRPYLYLRTTVDQRIVAGGLDEDQPETPHSETLINSRAERIRDEVQRLFPALPIRIAYRWAAVFGESVDNLPFIGRHPYRQKLYYLLGYGGNGTVYSMLGSHILKDLISGRPNRDAEIVRLDRESMMQT